MMKCKIYPYRIIKHILNYIVIAFLILNSGSAIMTVQKYANNYLVILAGTGVFCFFVSVLCKKHLSIKKDSIFNTFIVLTFINLVSLLFNFSSYSISMFFKPMLILFVALIFVNCYSYEEFTYYYTNTIKVLCVIALIAYCLYCVIQIPCLLPEFKNYNGVTYRNGYLFVLMENYGIIFKRAMSVFWEPGLFATMIYFSFILEVLLPNKSIKFRTIILYLLTMWCTVSVSALLILPFAAMLLIKRKLKKKEIVGLMILLLICLILFVNQEALFKMLVAINPRLGDELFSENNMSFFARMVSPVNNLKIFLTNPIVGVGYGKANAIYNTMQTVSQTSSSTYYLAALGIGGSMYTIYWIIAFVKMKNISRWAKFGGIMMILFLLNKEPHSGILMTCCMLFYMLKIANITRGM